ncbi:MAG: EamA family transporter [Chloroflexota bacterium]
MSGASGPLLILLAAVLWGTTGTAQAFAPSSAASLSIGAVRQAIAGLALLGLAAGRGSLRAGPHRWPVWTTLLAAACMAGYQLTFFAGVARTGVAMGTMIAIGSAPVLAGGFGWLLRGERPARRWFFATALALLGCVLLVATGRQVQLNLAGMALALAAGACYAAYAVLNKNLLDTHPPDAALALIFCLGALLLSPLLFSLDLAWLLQPRGLLVALHLGLVATTLAYSLFAAGLRYTPVASAVTLSLAEPFTAALLGIFLLGERPAPSAWVGIALLFASLLLLSLRK